MRLDPDTIGYRLRNAHFYDDVIEEIKQAIVVKNELDDYIKENNIR